MPKRTVHNRAKSSHHPLLVWGGIGAACVIVLMLASERSQYNAATSSYSVCVGVTVIGPDGGDPGTSYCDTPGPATSSSSSSSSSSESFSSFESSSSSLAQASVRSRTQEVVDNGGRRYSLEESQSSIGRLIEQWRRRYRLHGAASSSSMPAHIFPDVPVDSWFADAIYNFAERGIITTTQPLFRPADGATRAETAKLLVLVHGAQLSQIPEVPSFDDAPAHAWFYTFVEGAAFQGWMKGYNNCYLLHPCYTRPAAIVTRAEAAALIVRSFHLERAYTSPWIDDVPDDNAWYVHDVRTAADHCILQGDAGTNNVRPNNPVSRAELVTMLYRAEQDLHYGVDCVRGESSFKPAAPRIDAPVNTSAVLDADGTPVSSSLDSTCLAGVWSCVSEAVVGDAVSIFQKVTEFVLFGLPH